MNDARTNSLVADWRAADNQYGHLEHRWPTVRLVMWTAALAAVVMLIMRLPVWAPATVTIATLVFGVACAIRIRTADRAVENAWDALAEHTGLDGEPLVKLIEEIEARSGS